MSDRKVAVVTGAAQGIGASIASQLVRDGYDLAVLDIDGDRLEERSRALEALSRSVRIESFKCDVRSESSVNDAIALVLKKFGTIDVLVANAGVARPKRFLELTVDEWDDVFAVNTRGVFLCARAVAPSMIAKRRGRIIIASSFAAIIPSVGSLAYAASKSAVVSMTRVLAAELGPFDVTVNSYAPGMIPSNMSGIDSLPRERKEEMLDTLCLREWGRGEDIASLVSFLASDAARYITGSHIDASGGKFAVQFAKLAR